MNADPDVRCVIDARNILGEVPVWDAGEQALYWADIEGRLLQRYNPATGHVERWSFDERVCALALREAGGLVLALATGFAFFDPATGTLRRLVAPEAHLPNNRMNDGKCDRRGRFWPGPWTTG